jgi:ABC-type transport system substrate-binding protein
MNASSLLQFKNALKAEHKQQVAYFKKWIRQNPDQVIPALNNGFPNNEFMELIAPSIKAATLFKQTLINAFRGRALPEPESTTALVVACGSGSDLQGIHDFAHHIYAFDRRPIADPQGVNNGKTTIHLAQFDGTGPYPEAFERTYEIIIMRHPEVFMRYNISDSEATNNPVSFSWQNIFVQALRRLHENGYLLITTYYEPEAIAIKQYLADIGIQVEYRLNPHNMPMPRNAFLEAVADSGFGNLINGGPKMRNQRRDHYTILFDWELYTL